MNHQTTFGWGTDSQQPLVLWIQPTWWLLEDWDAHSGAARATEQQGQPESSSVQPHSLDYWWSSLSTKCLSILFYKRKIKQVANRIKNKTETISKKQTSFLLVSAAGESCSLAPNWECGSLPRFTITKKLINSEVPCGNITGLQRGSKLGNLKLLWLLACASECLIWLVSQGNGTANQPTNGSLLSINNDIKKFDFTTTMGCIPYFL